MSINPSGGMDPLQLSFLDAQYQQERTRRSSISLDARYNGGYSSTQLENALNIAGISLAPYGGTLEGFMSSSSGGGLSGVLNNGFTPMGNGSGSSLIPLASGSGGSLGLLGGGFDPLGSGLSNGLSPLGGSLGSGFDPFSGGLSGIGGGFGSIGGGFGGMGSLGGGYGMPTQLLERYYQNLLIQQQMRMQQFFTGILEVVKNLAQQLFTALSSLLPSQTPPPADNTTPPPADDIPPPPPADEVPPPPPADEVPILPPADEVPILPPTDEVPPPPPPTDEVPPPSI